MNSGTRICSATLYCYHEVPAAEKLKKEKGFFWLPVLKGQELAPNNVLLDGRSTTGEETRSAHVSPSWKVTRIQPLGHPDDLF